MQNQNNPKAFPVSVHPRFALEDGEKYVDRGMDLRDYFAAAALAGIKANDALLKRIMDCSEANDESQQVYLARMAYSDADAMLAERERKAAS
jgi:hypothetical protein